VLYVYLHSTRFVTGVKQEQESIIFLYCNQGSYQEQESSFETQERSKNGKY